MQNGLWRYGRYLTDAVPSNFVRIFLDENVTSVILFAFIFGFASMFVSRGHLAEYSWGPFCCCLKVTQG